MTDKPDPGYVVDVINAYRRIRNAAQKGTGVRLSAAEVARIWALDDAIQRAVESADELDQEATQ